MRGLNADLSQRSLSECGSCMLPDGGAKLLHPNWDKNQAVKRHQLHLLKRGRVVSLVSVPGGSYMKELMESLLRTNGALIQCTMFRTPTQSLQRRQLFSLTLTKREVKHAMSQQLYCLDNRRNARDVSSFVRSITVLSQRFHDNRRNVPSCLSARQGNREEEEEAARGDGEDTLQLRVCIQEKRLHGLIIRECKRNFTTCVCRCVHTDVSTSIELQEVEQGIYPATVKKLSNKNKTKKILFGKSTVEFVSPHNLNSK
ncbi:hypothetical protein F2P81_023533 [Scophthalmus maximus]|uniref:Uncharacterized protein n=1 Tax=Scophthalmus maximus TaxID=52904 RepID=A0A6A4S0L9_SCOMX|nr:hypothetical protein F2P81_023533 [Scophthalmus maximus]